MPVEDASSPRALSRRRFLRAVALGVPAVLAVAGPGRALASAFGTRSIELVNTHTGESLVAEYFRDGAYRPESLAALDQLLRDHRSGEVARIDRQLFDQLHDLATLAGRDARFEVISGYRSPATNAMLNARSSGVARRSLHMEGRALDVRLVGCNCGQLRDLAVSMQAGGVGFYGRSDFVHLDTGRVRSWAG